MKKTEMTEAPAETKEGPNEYQVKDWADTLMKAEEIKGDKAKMKHVSTHLKKSHKHMSTLLKKRKVTMKSLKAASGIHKLGEEAGETSPDDEMAE